MDRDYRTIRGYQERCEEGSLSTAMEDYLEIISRIIAEKGYARIGMISSALHVKPSSASKMISKLKEAGHLSLGDGGDIYLTASGKNVAKYLLYRHETIERFLSVIGSEDPLKETELIEHFLSPKTVEAIEKALFLLADDAAINLY